MAEQQNGIENGTLSSSSVNQYKKAANHYNTASSTLSKPKQLVMLYDGMIKFMAQAKQGLADKNSIEALNYFEKVSNIIHALQTALDFEQGGEIADTLNNYYKDILARIDSASINKNLNECDYIIEDLKEMRNAWAEVAETK